MFNFLNRQDKTLLQRLKRVVGSLVPGSYRYESTVPASTDYSLIDRETARHQSFDGWLDRSVAENQHAAYRALIQQMYAGQTRQDLAIAADAVRRTGLKDPSILEVGCGSGYYSEILPHLLKCPIHYTGLDYSPAMIRLALECYPSRAFVVGDGMALPFAGGAFDIVMNGVSLMHMLCYEAAIAESRRVARHWCILHTVPVLLSRETTVLRKRAYGQMTIEIIFNEVELYRVLERGGLKVRHVLDSIPYDLKRVLDEATVARSYVCEVIPC